GYPCHTVDASIRRYSTRLRKRQGLQQLREKATRLDAEDSTPEGKTHMPCTRDTEGDREHRRGGDRGVGDHDGSSVDERHGSLLIWSTSGGRPGEVAMGISMVMPGMRLAGRLIPVILMVLPLRGAVVIHEVAG